MGRSSTWFLVPGLRVPANFKFDMSTAGRQQICHSSLGDTLRDYDSSTVRQVTDWQICPLRGHPPIWIWRAVAVGDVPTKRRATQAGASFPPPISCQISATCHKADRVESSLSIAPAGFHPPAHLLSSYCTILVAFLNWSASCCQNSSTGCHCHRPEVSNNTDVSTLVARVSCLQSPL